MTTDPTARPAGDPGDDDATAVLPVLGTAHSTDEDRTPPSSVASAGDLVDERSRRPRVRTVVWGLMLAAVGVGLIAWAGGASIDVQLAIIVLLGAGGLALLVGSLVPGVRRGRR